MKTLKQLIADGLVGKRVHFKGGCFLNLDAIGKVVDYSIVNSEIIYQVQVGDRVISIGANTPNLYAEIQN